MKQMKFSPVVYVFVLYLVLGIGLIISFFGLHHKLTSIEVVDLTPLAYALLAGGIILVLLSGFSILRVPIFHFLFNMLNLWLLIISGALVWLYFNHGNDLRDLFGKASQAVLAAHLPVSDPGAFDAPMALARSALSAHMESLLYLLIAATGVLGLVQVILYLPGSLRYVYHTYISPMRYTIKHVLVSVILFIPLLLAANFVLKLDDTVYPQLEAFLAVEPEAVKDKDNAFYPMLTLWMEHATDRTAAGKQWLARHRRLTGTSPPSPANQLSLPGMDPEDRAAINQLYIRRITNPSHDLTQEIHRYAMRYQDALNAIRSLYGYQEYREPLDYTAASHTDYFEDFAQSTLSLHRLNLLAAFANYQDDVPALAKFLRNDYYFNASVVRKSTDTTVRLVHLAKQDVTLQFLYHLLQDPALHTQPMYELIDHLPVLVAEVMDATPIARRKLQLLKDRLDEGLEKIALSPSPARFLTEYMLKYSQTLNCVYRGAVREYNLDNKHPQDHIAAQTAAFPTPELSNVIGDIICANSISADASQYFIKAVETNGKLMLLKARSKLLEKNIRVINTEPFLVNNSRKFFNPFTEGALKWDRDSQQIYFEYNNGKGKVQVKL